MACCVRFCVLLMLVLACIARESAGQPTPAPRNDCQPEAPCSVDAMSLKVKKHPGAFIYGFLVHSTTAIDKQKIALGQGPSGTRGQDNAENFDPNLNTAAVGPRVGRKMLQATAA